jgi:hypothetical protein
MDFRNTGNSDDSAGWNMVSKPIIEYVRLEDVIPTLDGLRTRILYDSGIVKDLIIVQYIIPYFSAIKNTYIVIYSEALYYKFKRIVRRIIEKKPELKEAFSSLRVIKIGFYEECEFGELVSFVKQGNVKDEFEGFMNTLNCIKSNDVLILCGSIAYFLTLTGLASFKKLVNMFSVLPEGVTLFGFKRINIVNSPVENLIWDLYDVIIYVEKDNASFDDSTYNFKVECELEDNRYGKLKIDGGLLKSIGFDARSSHPR